MLCLYENLFNETIKPHSSRVPVTSLCHQQLALVFLVTGHCSAFSPLFRFQSTVPFCIWPHFSCFHLPSCELSNEYKMLGVIYWGSSWVVVGGFFRIFNLTYTSFFGSRNPPHQWLHLQRTETIWFLRIVARNGNMRKECILNIELGTDGDCPQYPFWGFVA